MNRLVSLSCLLPGLLTLILFLSAARAQVVPIVRVRDAQVEESGGSMIFHLEWTADAHPMTVPAVSFGGDHSVNLALPAERLAGVGYAVEGSADLVVWSVMGQLNAGSLGWSGPADITDAGATGSKFSWPADPGGRFQAVRLRVMIDE